MTEAPAAEGIEDEGTPHRGWWHRLRPGWRRSIRATIAFLGTGLIAVVLGVLSAQYTGSLGPHVAEYSMTLNDEITVDMGPLGDLIIDSPMPMGLGVDAQVEQIPDELTVGGEQVRVDAGNALAGLTADLQSYLQFFNDPTTTLRSAAFGLANNAILRTVLYWSIILSAIMLGRLMAHGVLRDAFASAWHRPGVPFVSVAVVIAVIFVPAVPATRGSGGAGQTTPVLAGTPLESARITGRLRSLVDRYGAVVLDAIRDNEDYYAQVEQNVRAAYEDDPARLGPVGPLLPVPTVTPDPVHPAHGAAPIPQPADGADDADDDGSGSDTEPTDNNGDAGDKDDAGNADDVVSGADAEPTADGLEPLDGPLEPSDDPSRPTEADGQGAAPSDQDEAAEQDIVTMVIVADLHCDIGMSKVVGAVVEEAGADLILNAGDTVMSGTAVESICVNAFADHFGPVPVVVADGNHDSDTTSQQESSRGWTVLSGDPVEVEGVRFLGDSDPTITALGAPTRQTGPEDITDVGDRLRDRACELEEEGEDVDILLLHNPRGTEAALRSGCVGVSLSGHYHRRIGPWQRGLGVQYISSSTAGATYKAPTIGPLEGPASITVMRWDRTTRTPRAFRTIVIDPDRSVDLSPWYDFPARPRHIVENELPPVGRGPWE